VTHDRYLHDRGEAGSMAGQGLRGQEKRADTGSTLFKFTLDLTFTFKSKVSRDVFKNKNECQLTCTCSSQISLQCHMPTSMCHFIFLKCQLTCGSFLDNSHYMSNSKFCVSIDAHFFLGASFCVSNAKNLQKFVKHIHCFPRPIFASICLGNVISAILVEDLERF
jgi:hypothetical protein